MAGVTYYILGSGMATETNAIYLARLNVVVLNVSYMDRAIVYGRKQPGQPMSEAASGVAYLKARIAQGGPELIPDTTPKSISETMEIVARHVMASFKAWCAEDEAYGPDARLPMRPHRVVVNWPYVLRAKYLLWRQWNRQFPGVPWSAVSCMVTFVPVGGTFVPLLKRYPFTFIPRWVWHVVVRECGGWYKAIVDPFDTKLNQKREAAKVFNGLA